MSARRHTQAHLPPLEPHEALRFVELLQHVINAVWRAHGQEMGERLIDRHIANPESEPLPFMDGDDLPF